MADRRTGAPGVVASPGSWEEMSPTNASLPRNASSSSGGLLQGFLFLGASVVCFGTNNVPLRSLDVGDGIFFQLVFCGTMALEGLLVYLIRGCPEIWTLSLVSGLMYSMGNFLTVPILKTIGLGLGSLIWSVFSLLFAWATARGSALAVTTGICYGCSYTPIIYIKNNSLKNGTHYRGASQLAFIGASLQFVAYYTFFEACYYLGTIVTYPIGATGIKNFLILGVVIVTVLCGVSLITLSKIDL
ncbi:hypothetical protein CRUP_028383 [Coryphaenoides rupestris]|nr:hypothetical protein CRUP_028383 [Coryphaenoides rupestris]